MDSQKKKEIINQLWLQVEKGLSIEQIRFNLEEEVKSEQEIDLIILNIKNLSNEKFGNEILEMIKNGTYEERKRKFDFLDDSVLEFIHESQAKILIGRKILVLRSLVDEGNTTDEIIKKLEDINYFSRSLIINEITKYREKNKGKSSLSKFSFKGRLKRKEFIIRTLIVAGTILSLLRLMGLVGFIAIIPALVIIYYYLSQITKRLHDLGYSGWWSILFPVLFLIGLPDLLFYAILIGIGFFLFIKQGEEGENKYGL